MRSEVSIKYKEKTGKVCNQENKKSLKLMKQGGIKAIHFFTQLK
jgi:hypothetical protein